MFVFFKGLWTNEGVKNKRKRTKFWLVLKIKNVMIALIILKFFYKKEQLTLCSQQIWVNTVCKLIKICIKEHVTWELMWIITLDKQR